VASQHADWVLGFADETWWSRFARPHLHSWADPDDGPLRLIEPEEPKGDPDPKALACYGVLLRQLGRAERIWLRFVDGRPLSAITEQFLGWCCSRLQEAGVRVWVLIWDNASAACEQAGAGLDPRPQSAGQAAGAGRAHRVVLPAGQEPLAQPDRAQVGPWQASDSRARTAAQRPGGG
jgi:hypothetical protein